MAMNNETSGKPVLMSFKNTPTGGPEANSTKHGTAGVSAVTKYNLKNPEAYYRVSGGPTLGTPMGGPDEPASSKTPKALKKTSVPNMAKNNSARN